MAMAILFICFSGLMILSSSADDAAPRFFEKHFKDCADFAYDEIHKWNPDYSKGEMNRAPLNVLYAKDFYTCLDKWTDKALHVAASYNYRELREMEKCYAERVSAEAELNLPKPHTVEAFEDRYGPMEVLLRSYRCLDKGSEAYKIITDAKVLKDIRDTVWDWCIREVGPKEVENMMSVHVCRSNRAFRSLFEFYKFLTDNPNKASAFEDCFKRETRKYLKDVSEDEMNKYKVGSLIKYLRCRPEEQKKDAANKATWKQVLSTFVKRAKAPFITLAKSVRTLFDATKWKCITDEAPETSTWNAVLCSPAKRKALMTCALGKGVVVPAESKTPTESDKLAADGYTPTVVGASEPDDRMAKRLLYTLATPVRSIYSMICPDKASNLKAGSFGKATLKETAESFGITEAEATAGAQRKKRATDPPLILGIIIFIVIVVISIAFFAGAIVLCVLIFKALLPVCGWFLAMVVTLVAAHMLGLF